MNQKVFIISDTHFSHKNILKYESRPFDDVDHMDSEMIRRWNSVVSPNDLVFHLGDVIIAGAKRAEYILPQLNGRKILIEGNHDAFSKTNGVNLASNHISVIFIKIIFLPIFQSMNNLFKLRLMKAFLKRTFMGIHTRTLLI